MPRSSPEMRLSSADVAACDALLRSGSKSFAAAGRLLPAEVRAPATALYAFCRLADDAIDLSPSPSEGLEIVRGRIAAAYEGRPADHPADRGFAAVVAAYELPRTLPEALVEGFAWDAERRCYRTIDELHGYAARVAGSVGVMMSLIMGVREPAALARATDLGLAMQLTNIARDVGEDARAGRLYLPLDWLASEGIDPARFLAAPGRHASVRRVVERLLGEADQLYRSSASGIARLPLRCRPAIHAARLIYADIGRSIGRARFDSVSTRARVTGGRKGALLAVSILAAAGWSSPDDSPTVPAARFLLEGIPPAGRPRGVAADAVWLIDLIERLERADRARWRRTTA